jgi:hypothetical protein
MLKWKNESQKNNGVDKLTAAQMGGLENVTINQIIKILIFI